MGSKSLASRKYKDRGSGLKLSAYTDADEANDWRPEMGGAVDFGDNTGRVHSSSGRYIPALIPRQKRSF